MKVKLLTSLAGADRSYSAGDEYPCASADEAARLVEAGFAEHIRSVKVETAVRKPKVEKATK